MNGNNGSNNPFRKPYHSGSTPPEDERSPSETREPSSPPVRPTPPTEHQSTQQDLTRHSSHSPPQAVEPPPYEFGYGYTSGIYPAEKKPTTPESVTETSSIHPQYSQPYGLPPESSSSHSPPFGINLASSFRNPSPGNITHDPPPLSFSRQPPENLPYDPFQPIFLIANGKFLDTGFPLAAPPSAAQPHPFASHDVNEGDWIW